MSRVVTPDRCRTLFEGLVGRRTGIIREITRAEPIDGDAPLFYFGAKTANAQPDLPEFTGIITGGAGRTLDEALASTLCEGVERYAATSYAPLSQPPLRRDECAEMSLDPFALAQFSDEQRRQPGFPFPSPTPQAAFRWLTAHCLADDRPCAVPAFAAYLPYRPVDGESLPGPGISTGLCCAESINEAIVGGICEVIERDASALIWLKGVAPPRLDPGIVREHAADLLPPADEVTVYDITTDLGVPACFVVCLGQGPHGQIISVGSACHLDARLALRKAAKEASQDRVYVRLLIEDNPQWEPLPDFTNVIDFRFHARLYSGRPELARQAFACLNGNPLVVTSLPDAGTDLSAEEQLQRLCDALAARSFEGAWLDLTPAWARPLGLCVVKVLVPDLLPLHGNHNLAYRGHSRLTRHQQAMPKGQVFHMWPMWPWPHPSP